MNVHDAAFERAQEIAFQHPHETREHDQVDRRAAQRLDVRALGFFIQLGAKLPRRDELRRQLPLARVGENAGVLDVAHHQRDLRRNLPRRAGIGDGDKIRAAARTENANAEWTITLHAKSLTGRTRASASLSWRRPLNAG